MGYRKGYKPPRSGEPLTPRERPWNSDNDVGADHFPEDDPRRDRGIALGRKWGSDAGGASPETHRAAAEAAERSEADSTEPSARRDAEADRHPPPAPPTGEDEGGP